MTEINLSPVDIHALELYKNIVSGKPLNQAITLDDLVAVKELTETIPQLEEQYKQTFEEIEAAKAEIEEKKAHLMELEQSIDPKLLYLKSQPIVQPKTVTRTTNGSDNLKERILQILKSSYSLGNSEICEKLGIPNDKSNQNKVYGLAKKLEAEGLIVNEARMWKAK